jgi:hypothetical protein
MRCPAHAWLLAPKACSQLLLLTRRGALLLRLPLLLASGRLLQGATLVALSAAAAGAGAGAPLVTLELLCAVRELFVVTAKILGAAVSLSC